MELKPGYKQTEVGVIPEDWDVPCLGDYSEITKLAGFEYSNHFNSYKDGGEIIVIRGTNITHNSLDLSDVRTIPKSTSDKLPRSKLKKDDLVFAYVGTIGPVFLIDKDNRYHLGPNTARITCKDGLNPRFVFCYFHSNLIRKEITERISTGAQPSLSMTKIRAFRILKPTKAEQRAIAGALSDVDALLAKLDALIVKKRDLKQAAMQRLLTGQTRLPGFKVKHGFKQTELGVIPEDWLDTTLGEVCLFENGDRGKNYPSPAAFVQSGVPFVNAGHLSDGSVHLGEMNYITEASFDRLGSGKFGPGDILFCLRGSLGKFGLVRTDFGKGAIASSLVIVRPKSTKVSREYLFCYFASACCSRMIEKWSGGAAQPNLGAQDLARFSISIPSIPKEQRAIAAVLSDMDAEMAALESRRDKTRALKQGMMQELLTGRVRLI